MDLVSNPDVTAYVARYKTGDGTRTRIWAARDKAQGWITDQAPCDVEWRDRGDGDWIGESNGDIIGTVTRSKIMDPAALASNYPDALPASRIIDPDA